MDIALTHFLQEHTTRLKALNFSPTTIRTRHYNVQAFIAWMDERYGVRAAGALTPAHLRSWQVALSRHRTTCGMPLKPRSVNKKIECVRAFLSDLRQAGHVGGSLLGALEYVKVPDLLPRALTHRQVRGLLDGIDTGTAAGQRDRTMLELLYSSGLRAAELLGMDTGDFDPGAGTVRVIGKGRKERMVPVGATARRCLEGYIRATRPLLEPTPEENALFIDCNAVRMPYHTLRRIIAAIGRDAGLKEPLTPHVFRRSCTSELVRGNANLYHVSRMLGHESLDTLRHYVKLNINDIRRTHRSSHPRERDEQHSRGIEDDLDMGGDEPGGVASPAE